MREGLVAENDIIGTWAWSPRLITKFASIDVTGPNIACTSAFLIRSKAVSSKKIDNHVLYILDMNQFCLRTTI